MCEFRVTVEGGEVEQVEAVRYKVFHEGTLVFYRREFHDKEDHDPRNIICAYAASYWKKVDVL